MILKDRNDRIELGDRIEPAAVPLVEIAPTHPPHPVLNVLNVINPPADRFPDGPGEAQLFVGAHHAEDGLCMRQEVIPAEVDGRLDRGRLDRCIPRRHVLRDMEDSGNPCAGAGQLVRPPGEKGQLLSLGELGLQPSLEILDDRIGTGAELQYCRLALLGAIATRTAPGSGRRLGPQGGRGGRRSSASRPLIEAGSTGPVPENRADSGHSFPSSCRSRPAARRARGTGQDSQRYRGAGRRG